MGLGNTLPYTTMNDGVHILVVNAGDVSYLALGVRPGLVERKDTKYRILAILIAAICFAVLGLAQSFVSVSLILKRSYPLKVVDMIVMLVAVLVIRLMLVSGRSANKGNQHGAMGVDLRSRIVSIQSKGEILSLPPASLGLNYPAGARPISSSDATAATFVANLVDFLPSSDASPNLSSHKKISYGKPQEIQYTSRATRRLPGLSSCPGMLIALPGLFYALNCITGEQHGKMD